MSVCDDSDLVNNVVAFNYAYRWGGVYSLYKLFSNNIVWGNCNDYDQDQILLYQIEDTTGNIIEDWTYGGVDNFTSVPLFADPWNLDFRLLPTSPGIDDGTSNVWSFAGTDPAHLDMTGTTRPLGLDWDIGAYEFTTASLTAIIQAQILGQPPYGPNRMDGSPWPVEWPEEWMEEVRSIELPTTAVAMLTSYTLQVAGASTTAGLDLNQDGIIDIADLIQSLTQDAASSGSMSGAARAALSQWQASADSRKSRTSAGKPQGSPLDTWWAPPRPGETRASSGVAPELARYAAQTARRRHGPGSKPTEAFRQRWGAWAEPLWRAEHEIHPGAGPITIDLRGLPAPDPLPDPDALEW